MPEHLFFRTRSSPLLKRTATLKPKLEPSRVMLFPVVPRAALHVTDAYPSRSALLHWFRLLVANLTRIHISIPLGSSYSLHYFPSPLQRLRWKRLRGNKTSPFVSFRTHRRRFPPAYRQHPGTFPSISRRLLFSLSRRSRPSFESTTAAPVGLFFKGHGIDMEDKPPLRFNSNRME